MDYVCNDTSCKMKEGGDHEPNMENCRTASSLLQFFELASEGWFMCVSFDIRESLSNPFSNYKTRMVWYHIVSWSMGLITAMLMFSSGSKGFEYSDDLKSSSSEEFSSAKNAIYGFWYVTRDVDDTVFCWFKSDNKSNLLTANVSTNILVQLCNHVCVDICISNRLGLGSSFTFLCCVCIYSRW